MNKQSELFYEARDSIESGKYLKASKRTLRKYLAELSNVPPWPNNPTYNDPRMYRENLRGKVEREIESRKLKFASGCREFLFLAAIAVVAGIIVLYAWSKIENKTDATSKTIKSQPSPTQEAKTSQLPAVANYSASRRLPPEKKPK